MRGPPYPVAREVIASRCRTTDSVACPEVARGEPDDVGVDGDLDGGVAAAVVWLAGASAQLGGEFVLPGRRGELAHPVLLAGNPGAVAQSAVDGGGCVAGRRLGQLPRVAVQPGEVTAVGAARDACARRVWAAGRG
jgi:hypothetical protein